MVWGAITLLVVAAAAMITSITGERTEQERTRLRLIGFVMNVAAFALLLRSLLDG